MLVPIEVAARCAAEGGMIEADRRGGVWWLKGKAMAAWGNLRHLTATKG